jgi:hypothetical protein
MNYHKVTKQISNLHGKRLKVHSFTVGCGPKSTPFHYYFFTLFLLYSPNSLTSYTPTY